MCINACKAGNGNWDFFYSIMAMLRWKRWEPATKEWEWGRRKERGSVRWENVVLWNENVFVWVFFFSVAGKVGVVCWWVFYMVDWAWE